MRISDWSSDVCSSVLIDHHRGRRGVDAELVLDRGAAHAVGNRRPPLRVEAVFGDEEERDTARPFWRARRAREDEVNDIVGQVMLAEGDEDLRSEEHTSELQSLMRISYAVFCLKKKK